jgi:hypothetical protein
MRLIFPGFPEKKSDVPNPKFKFQKKMAMEMKLNCIEEGDQ